MNRTALGVMFALAAALPVLCQPLPKNHPVVVAPDRRIEVSKTTEAVAGKRGVNDSRPIPRKNFIDTFIFGKMERDKIPHAPLSTDTEFFRRIHLDLTGRLPEPMELKAFVASKDPDKRDKLIDSLVTQEPFLSKWTYWFGDLAAVNSNRLGTDGRNLFYKYIYDAMHLNRPYNEVVEELITARAASNWYVGPASYLVRWVVIGDTCADTVHEDTSDEIAIHTAKHFLGINLQCVSCHDGAHHLEKINLWLSNKKRADLWKQAAFFGNTRVLRRTEIETTRDEYSIDDKGPGYDAAGRSVVRIPRGGKGKIEPAFIFSGAKPESGRPPRSEYARMLTSDPQFARAAVNTFWAQMMGVGIVDPPDEFDMARLDPANPPPAPWTIQPTHPELLEALAKDFREHDHNLRRLFTLIAKSSAYQLSSGFPGEWKHAYAAYFARKFVRRLTAEEMHDAITKATELYTQIPVPNTDMRVKFATQARSPEDFRRFRDLNFFLEVFGQPNRDYSERSNEGSISQAVLLMNSPFVKDKVKASTGSFLSHLLEQKPALTEDEIVEELYLRFLVRPPTADERSMARSLVSENRKQGFEDLQWLLLNKVDFIFNY